MPSIPTKSPGEPFETYKSFTVINKDTVQPSVETTVTNEQMTSSKPLEHGATRYKNVNVVKPIQRKPPNESSAKISTAHVETNINNNNNNEPTSQPKKQRAKKVENVIQTNTILDPRFSRNLDLKLRKLKEKEIIAERLSRRAKEKSKINSIRSVPPKTKKMSNSYPNVNLIRPKIVNLELRNDQVEDDSIQKTSYQTKSCRGKVSYSNENVNNNNNRPLFITTVKKGFFLPPPPEIASLLGLEKYLSSYTNLQAPSLVYSYSSKPKVVAPPAPAALKSSTISVRLPDINGDIRNSEIPLSETHVVPTSRRTGIGGAARALAALSTLAAGTAAVGSGCPQPGVNKKIIRGSTMNFGGAGDAAAEARRKAIAKRRVPRSTTLPDTQPYKAVQTDQYLEELFDKGEEFDVGVQTDFLPERPTTPKFVQPKKGYDKWTQIWPGDLFNFDEEVTPVIELLVGKTVEQALTEVLQEEEVAAMRKKAEESEAKRAAAAAIADHHQRHLARMHKLKERHLAEAVVATEAGRCEAQKAAAAMLVRTHLPALLPNVLKTLQEQGYLQTEKETDLDETFFPWLLNEVSMEVEQMITSRDVIMDIVKEVLETRAELFRIMREASPSLGSASTEHMTSHGEQGEEESQTNEEEQPEENAPAIEESTVVGTNIEEPDSLDHH